ncbi:MAG: anti-sigma factor family protein [Spirosomataceae bacterium]
MKELDASTFEQIHAYLRGEGSPQERAQFESRLQADTALAEELKNQQRVQTGLKTLAHKKRLEAIHAELKASGNLKDEVPKTTILPLNPKKSSWKSWVAAASILLVAGAAWFVFVKPTESPSSTPLVQKTEEKQDTVAAPVLSEERNVAADIKKIPKANKSPLKTLFEQNFDANPRLSSPFSQEKMGLNPGLLQLWETETAAFFKGVDLLEKGEANQALALFEKTTESRFDELRPYGEWYVILALIRLEEVNLAMEKLRKVSQTDGHLYQLRARNLLVNLQKEIQ